jgi:hypothetical protein
VPTSFVAYATYGSNASVSATVDKPVGTQLGDLMICQTISGTTGDSPSSIPDGWNLIAYSNSNIPSRHLWYKIATNSEPSNYTWNWSSNSWSKRVTISTYRNGFTGSNPIYSTSNTVYTVFNNIVRAASFNVPTKNSTLLLFPSVSESTNSVSFSKPTSQNNGWYEDYDLGTNLTNFCAAYRCNSFDAGDTGDIDSVFAGYAGDTPRKHAFAIALKPKKVSPFPSFRL